MYEFGETGKDVSKVNFHPGKISDGDLDKVLEMLVLKGNITQQEIDGLKILMGVSQRQVEERVSVPIQKEQNYYLKQKFLENQIDYITRERILSNLKILNMRSLYEFLEVSQNSNIEVLEEAIRKKFKCIKKYNIRDTIFNANNMLIGLCEAVFKTEKSKRKYDFTFQLLELHKIDKLLEVAALDGAMFLPEYDFILKEGLKLGCEPQIIQEYIKLFCYEKKIFLEMGNIPQEQQFKKCFSCGGMNIQENECCEFCGFNLDIDCPECGNELKTSTNYCTICGNFVGNISNAIKLLEDAEKNYMTGKFVKAVSELEKAKEYWPSNVEIDKKIQNIIREKQETEGLVSETKQLILEKRYYKALDNIKYIKDNIKFVNVIDIEKEVEGKIRFIENWLSNAMLNEDTKLIEEALIKIISECRDCNDAIELLNEIPPQEPKRIEVEIKKSSILIKWDKVETKADISYRVVRKIAGEEQSEYDVCETAHCEYEDFGVKFGEKYYYEVFTIRNQVISKKSVKKGPIGFSFEVEQLRCRQEGEKINLSWKYPISLDYNNIGIEVWRKDGEIPSKRGDGICIDSVGMNGFVDENVLNGHTYGYRIILVGNRNQFISKGITCIKKLIKDEEISINREGMSQNLPPINEAVQKEAKKQDISVVSLPKPVEKSLPIKEFELLYDVEVEKGVFGKIKSVLITFDDVTNTGILPEVTVVKKIGEIPERITDGTIICVIPKTNFNGEQELLIKLNIHNVEKDTYIKVFIHDERYILLESSNENLKIS